MPRRTTARNTITDAPGPDTNADSSSANTDADVDPDIETDIEVSDDQPDIDADADVSLCPLMPMSGGVEQSRPPLGNRLWLY